MKFISNNTRDWSEKDEDNNLNIAGTYVEYNQEFDSFEDALEAAKKSAYHSKENQEVKLVVAEIKPIIERLETDFSMDPATFNTEK